MGPLTIILGSAFKGEAAPGRIRLVTPRGDVLSVDKKDVVHTSNADAGGDLKRYAIGPDAIVHVETTGAALRGADFVSGTFRWIGGTDKHQGDKTPPFFYNDHPF